MTPFEIEILMHYYTRGGDPDVVRDNPPIWPETRVRFLDEKLLELMPVDYRRDDPATYMLTQRGQAYIKALMRVPLPVASWRVEWPENEGGETP